MENKACVQGIEEIECIERLGGFDVGDIVKTIELHKDAILKVERIDVISTSRPTVDYAIKVCINLKADKKKLIDAITDMFNKFKATSVDLDSEKNGKTLTFWWDTSKREI